MPLYTNHSVKRPGVYRASPNDRNLAGNLEAAGPGFEPGLSDSESEFLFSSAYRSVREYSLNKPNSRYQYRTLIRHVPPALVSMLVSNGRLCRAPSVTAARRTCSCDLQGGVRQQAQGDVPMPGVPAAHLVLGHLHFLWEVAVHVLACAWGAEFGPWARQSKRCW
jgi:hypothetical protein